MNKNYKNRNREKPSFFNVISVQERKIESAKCNNYLNIHFNKWKNFEKFLNICKKDNYS